MIEQELSRGVEPVIIGTGPTDWFAGRQQCLAMLTQQILDNPGLQVEDSSVTGWEDGDMGWAVDRPTIVLPDGTRISTRVSWVLRRENGAWCCVHAHTSVGIPDEVLMGLVADEQS